MEEEIEIIKEVESYKESINLAIERANLLINEAIKKDTDNILIIVIYQKDFATCTGIAQGGSVIKNVMNIQNLIDRDIPQLMKSNFNTLNKHMEKRNNI